METIAEIRHFLKKGHIDYRPNITVECTIFGYHEGQLKVLLGKNKIVTMWCLPGGYVRKDESLDQAAARLTVERTGIQNLFLKQFKTFGDPGRTDARGAVDLEKLFELTGLRLNDKTWLSGETVSVGFYAISDIVHAIPKADFASSECKWFPVNKLPELAFDHKEIIREALHTMRIHLYHYPIGKNLLRDRFTLKDIKLFYEAMSGKKLHVSNFPSKLIALGLIKKTNKKKSIGAHRAPTFYQFDKRAYANALKEGLVLA